MSIFISILLGRGANCIAATSMKLEGYVYGERVLRVENRDPDDGLFADELDYQNKTLFEKEGNENKEVLPGKTRSRDAFSKITGYTLPNYTYDEALKSEEKMKEFTNQFDKFDKEIWLAMQEIHAAHDYKTGKGSCKDSDGELYNINIKKFMLS